MTKKPSRVGGARQSSSLSLSISSEWTTVAMTMVITSGYSEQQAEAVGRTAHVRASNRWARQ